MKESSTSKQKGEFSTGGEAEKTAPRGLENLTRGLGPPRVYENSTQAFGMENYIICTSRGIITFLDKNKFHKKSRTNAETTAR